MLFHNVYLCNTKKVCYTCLIIWVFFDETLIVSVLGVELWVKILFRMESSFFLQTHEEEENVKKG